ncbi:MAG: hypothetical protein ABJB74_22785 [Gemmatimonas sp.]
MALNKTLFTSRNTFVVSKTSVFGAAIVFLLLGLLPASGRISAELHGQSPSPPVEHPNSFSIEANPIRGTLSYTRFASPKWEFGVSAGFGFPQADQTLSGKKGADFRDYLNIGAIARTHFANDHALLELGARAGVADYFVCTASDCWPQAYVGPSVLAAVGGRRVKVGTRLTAGWIAGAGHDADVFASVSPVNLLVSWRW